MSRRRQVSDEERALWRSVTRTVSPLRHRRKEPEAATERAAPKQRPALGPSLPSRPVAAVHKPASKPKQPALAPLDRRAKQRLARGTQPIDARLDLHGRTQAQAHAALLRFLHRAQAKGAKTVLVITGKGSGADARRGVLRQQVPMWLALPEFRGLVVGFDVAAIVHGGDGAFYVRVRRARLATE